MGPNSTGKFNVKMKVTDSVQIFGLSDVQFTPSRAGEGDKHSTAMNFKVYRNNSGEVELRFESTNSSGSSFRMTAGGADPGAGGDAANKAFNFSIDVHQQANAGGTASSVSKDGDVVVLDNTSDNVSMDNNASLIVKTNVPVTVDSGDYSATVTVVVSPR